MRPLEGQRIAVAGMGRSGQAASMLAMSLGARVTTVDQNPSAEEIEGCTPCHGKSAQGVLASQDRVILSPGIAASHPMLADAKNAGVPVVGELGFAAEHCQLPVIAITGTNGKSSTAWYCAQLLSQAGHEPFLGGNFGTALSCLALEPGRHDIAVVEVSSYQLELPGSFRPDFAAALNLTPDHLARHGNMEAYGEAKRRIFQQQTESDVAISPKGDPRLHARSPAQKIWLDAFPGARISEGEIHLEGTRAEGTADLSELRLLGRHNLQNVSAAVLLAVSAGVGLGQLDLGKLLPLDHRLQTVHESQGIKWINDSKATNIEAAMAGIAGVPGPQILLLGGQGKKGADYGQLVVHAEERARLVVCFGAAGPEIAEALGGSLDVETVPDLASAARLSARCAQHGDSILLSPACASFDEFDSFEHRGRAFSRLAREPRGAG
jgi:UDP-N-acetylmuramoylalanine--D-glutamate ligase